MKIIKQESSIRYNLACAQSSPRIRTVMIKTETLLHEPVHEKILKNVVCSTSKASDQPAYMRSLIRAFASRLNIL